MYSGLRYTPSGIAEDALFRVFDQSPQDALTYIPEADPYLQSLPSEAEQSIGWARESIIAYTQLALTHWKFEYAYRTGDSQQAQQELAGYAALIGAILGPEPPLCSEVNEYGGSPPSIKGRIKAAQLPTEGKIRYIPPENWHPSQPLPRGPRNGYLDRFGNEWTRGPSRTPGEPFEWDVQLGRNATPGMRELSRDGNHVNVSLKGRVTHK